MMTIDTSASATELPFCTVDALQTGVGLAGSADGVDWVKATVKGFGGELEVVPDAQRGVVS
jgi:hypothetical protein